ncbi:DUF349 domain-containing protein [Mycetocola tolaasinivorans]|uniref:DUF349 domain-containing protein n=1 Tax=Mycetocola tolaasinivorans TaxID=76635 RepID=A0A3L6ZXR5_9MICO|nr:DUF349 domain-containing protein [Mycetocola tolaasinivorans]RLP72281.1 DUF349 domain-containing protein [Mycetocola tolaasinivorans]
MSTSEQQPWGRVDDSGTVFVREGEEWREVGQYPDGTAEEALGYFERKFLDLAGQVTLLEQRAKRGAPATDISKAVAKLREELTDAKAVGDIASLVARVGALDETVGELTEQQSEQAKAELEEAVAERTRIVEAAEAVAAQDPAKTQWKQATEQMAELFAAWQKHQQEGPKLSKGLANDLWKRFRTARGTVDANRRAFFAELDAVHKEARTRKQKLIEAAEALIPRGAEATADYRRLLDEWKLSGRAGKRQDDSLWARFKAAGDAIYQAKAELDAIDSAEFQVNYEKKRELLDQATPLLQETDREKLRSALLNIQRQWDEVGKVPREKIREVEDGLRAVENHLRALDDEHWSKNNPETKARTEGLAGQLNAAIEKLEQELAAAEATGDAKKIAKANEALEARKAWLNVLG